MVALDGRARRKLRRDEYDRMVMAGLFHGEHVELIRGELVRWSSIATHAADAAVAPAGLALPPVTLGALLRDA